MHASVRDGWWAAWWPGKEAGAVGGVRIVVRSGGTSRTYDSSAL